MNSAQAIPGKQCFRPAVAGGDAGGGDGLVVAQVVGDFAVEGEQLFEQIGFGAEAVGGEDGGVERGVGVAQRVPAGQVEAAVEGAQAAGEIGQRIAADVADFAAGGGDGVDLFFAGGLRPGEGVEDGFGGVAEIRFHFRALGEEPLRVGGGLQDTEDVVVGESKNLQGVAGADGGVNERKNWAFGNA